MLLVELSDNSHDYNSGAYPEILRGRGFEIFCMEGKI